ncbi:MAG: 4-hydroxy-2-oxo-heptane-1,7-dioate aldolase [Rhodobacteraceae bacterium]|nr:4-hydroxy-2-oxo-heptane-1,7-dioate aldolase [Paracoccaceae bacterium]
MKNPKNLFKAAIKDGRHQLGIWNTIGGNTVPELLGGAGFDWVLIDCEHSAIETVEVLPALQAIASNPQVSAAVRPAANDPTVFKRVLDMGAQTLLVPFIQSVEEAEAAVTAMRYGPGGVRGMAGMTRATRYGKVDAYFTSAEDDLCLILQIETVKGLAALEGIATTDGVDAIFFGPADLSASMGYPGQMAHPEVVGAIEDGLRRLRALGVPGGVMALDVDAAKRFIELGSLFTAVGVDLVLLADAVDQLRGEF